MPSPDTEGRREVHYEESGSCLSVVREKLLGDEVVEAVARIPWDNDFPDAWDKGVDPEDEEDRDPRPQARSDVHSCLSAALDKAFPPEEGGGGVGAGVSPAGGSSPSHLSASVDSATTSTQQGGRRHELKTWPGFFEPVASGRKTFEVRRNDRGFQSGDVLVLQEYDEDRDEGDNPYTGRECERIVTYVLPGGLFGVDPDFCVLALTQPVPETARCKGKGYTWEPTGEVPVQRVPCPPDCPDCKDLSGEDSDA